METHNIEAEHDLYYLTNLLETSKDTEVVFHFSKDNKVYRNSSNLKILHKIAEENKIDLKFEAENLAHKDYIDSVNGDYAEYNDETVNLDQVSENPSLGSSSLSVGEKRGLNVFGFLSLLKFKPKPKTKNPLKLFKVLSVLLGIIIIIGGILFALWWYFPTAKVKLSLDSEVLIKLLDINAVIGQADVNGDESKIPAIKLDVTESDSQTIPTTGIKEVGEKAEGEIKIFNKTSDKIKLSKGKKITYISTKDENLKYEIIEDIEIDAQTEVSSTDASNVTTVVKTPGEKNVKIKAIEIGENYNLEKEKQFQVEGYDTDKLIAENSDKIKGGTLEEINIVTQKDIDQLKRELEIFMQNKVKDSLQKKTVNGQELPETSIVYEVSSAKFDKALDAEGDELTLTMTTKGTGLAYSKDDLDKIVSELISKVVPEEYDLDQADPQYEVAVLQADDPSTTLKLQVKLHSSITPKIDEEKLKSDLAGMKIDEATKYLNGIKNVLNIEIQLSPKLPVILQGMPQRKENITIEVNK